MHLLKGFYVCSEIPFSKKLKSYGNQLKFTSKDLQFFQ